MNGGVRREPCKGGADGGGGRTKDKTKAGRHFRTPAETWPFSETKEIFRVNMSRNMTDMA